MSATAGNADRTTLLALTANLDIGDTADPALRLAYFQYMTDLSDANYAYLQSLVTSGTLSPMPPDFMYLQGAYNGFFDVWERDKPISMVSGSRYTADRWSYTIDSITSGTVTLNQNQSNAPTAQKNCFEIDYSAAVGVTDRLEQSLRTVDVAKYRSKQVILTVVAKVSVGTLGANLAIVDGTNTDAYPSTSVTQDVSAITLSTSYQTFTILHTVQSGANALTLRLVSGSKAGFTGKIYISSVQLSTGTVSLPLAPRRYEEEKKLCSFYCQVYGGQASQDIFGVGTNDSTSRLLALMSFPEMRIAPTPTFTGVATYQVLSGTTAVAATAIASADATKTSMLLAVTVSGTPLTAGYAGILRQVAGQVAKIILDSEI